MLEKLDGNMLLLRIIKYKWYVFSFFFVLWSPSKKGQLYENIFSRFLHCKTIVFLVIGIKINVFVEMTNIVGGSRF